MTRRSFSTPPRAFKRAKRDNLALVPGSMLPYMEQWQDMANELPVDGVLIVVPDGNVAQKTILLAIAKLLAREGHQVRVVPEAEMNRRGHLVQGRLPFPSETRRR
jgi:hypothetical protein